MKSLWYKAVVEERGGLYVLARMFFIFLSLFYRLAIAVRRLIYWLGIVKPVKLPCKVISVGNIAVGGTGKTPLVIYLAKMFSQSGKKVGILARGYGGIHRPAKGGINSDAKDNKDNNLITDDEDLFGDIPNVIRIAQPDRVSAGKKLCAEGVEVIILDDGFQHWRIKRDVDIVVIDSVNPFGRRRLFPLLAGLTAVLPAGILREPLKELSRADIFVLSHSDLVKPGSLTALEESLQPFRKPIIRTVHQPLELVPLSGGEIISVNNRNSLRVYGFCGIGSPERFKDTLKGLFELVGFDLFPDHYAYDNVDLDNIVRKAKTAGARMLVTTEKDALRLKATPRSHRDSAAAPPGIDRLALPIYYLRIELKIVAGEKILSNLLMSND